LGFIGGGCRGIAGPFDNLAPGGETYSGGDEEQKTFVDPITLLTMMRSVQPSMSRDRSEIDGARRPLLQGDDGPGVGGGGTVDVEAGPAQVARGSPSSEPLVYDNQDEDPCSALSDRVPHPSTSRPR